MPRGVRLSDNRGQKFQPFFSPVFPSLTFPLHLFPNSTPRRFQPQLASLHPSLIFPLHLLPSSVHPTGISIYTFTDFLAIFISSNKNNRGRWFDTRMKQTNRTLTQLQQPITSTWYN